MLDIENHKQLDDVVNDMVDGRTSTIRSKSTYGTTKFVHNYAVLHQSKEIEIYASWPVNQQFFTPIVVIC